MTEPLTTACRAARGLFALVAVLAATTTPARAQCEMCEDMAPPGISFSPSTSTTTLATLPVTITWQDDTQLTPSTRSITLNGVVITGSFSYSGSATTATSSGTVALQPGVNWLVAEIWDGAQNQAVDSVRLTLDSFLDVSPQERATLSTLEGAATMAYAPPPYVSLDHSRSVALHYASTHAQPRGLVQVDATDVTSTPPDAYSILLKKPDGSLVTFTNGASEIFYRGGAGITRLAVLFDAASYATGSHPFTVVVRKWRGGVKTAEQTRPVRVVVVNEAGNPVGWGWSVAGLARLVVQTDGVLLISGSGDTEWYPVSCPGCATYRGLPAQAATLAKEVGGTYTRRGADGSTWSFDAMGRLTKIEARGGLATTYGYTAAGSLSWVQDPAGHRMTLTYDAAGLLARISDPGVNAGFECLTSGGRNVPAGGEPVSGRDLR